MNKPFPVGVAIQLVDENDARYGVRHADNKICVSSMPQSWDIAAGNVSGLSPLRFFGHNADLDTSIETIWSTGGLYPWQTAAGVLKITSSSAEDDKDAGDGARTVLIAGLDADYGSLSETIEMEGASVVTTDGEFLRVNLLSVVAAGATSTNEGTITVKDSTATDILGTIEPGEGISHDGRYTIPAGYTAYITQWTGSEASKKGTIFALFARRFGGPWISGLVFNVNGSHFFEPLSFPFDLPEKTDIEIRGTGISDDAVVSSSIEGWLKVD